MTDEQLCNEARSGQREAEEVLAERYLPVVRACARPYFLAGGSSEDVTQEGMLGLIAAIREYRAERGGFKTFAERCIKNRIFDSMKAAARDKHKPLNTYISIDPFSFENGEHLLQPSTPGPEQDLVDRESYSERLRELCEPLSLFEAQVLGLYLDGLTTAEISESIGKPYKSVDNAVQRVRKKLTRQLQQGDHGR